MRQQGRQPLAQRMCALFARIFLYRSQQADTGAAQAVQVSGLAQLGAQCLGQGLMAVGKQALAHIE
jgi:hypothetical protein